jgi:hypothetical protein
MSSLKDKPKTINKILECKYCNFRCFGKASLLNHIKAIHNKETKCVICDKSILDFVLVPHHISYLKVLGENKINPEVEVTLCRSCHIKEHLNDDGKIESHYR